MKVILLTTDATPHIAMDGKLAAILEANDMKCHLEAVRFFSISQLVSREVQPMFDNRHVRIHCLPVNGVSVFMLGILFRMSIAITMVNWFMQKARHWITLHSDK